MPQSLFVFASGAGARIRAVQPAAVLRNGFRPDRPARGRACEPCGLGLALSVSPAALSGTGGLA